MKGGLVGWSGMGSGVALVPRCAPGRFPCRAFSQLTAFAGVEAEISIG